ncbi:hypothetical protein RCH18_002962 [Flavobacterium sp. PL11]|nr:hypothetical protein [Flavobacterium sp. PL11]
MNKFEITLSPNQEICLELTCLNCRSIFSTELDLNFINENLTYSRNDVSYCIVCEKKYDYSIKFDSNLLEILVRGKKINSCLKKSRALDCGEYKPSTTAKSKILYNTQIYRLEQILELDCDEHIIEQSPAGASVPLVPH